MAMVLDLERAPSRVLGTRVALASLEVKEADVLEHKTITWNKAERPCFALWFYLLMFSLRLVNQ